MSSPPILSHPSHHFSLRTVSILCFQPAQASQCSCCVHQARANYWSKGTSQGSFLKKMHSSFPYVHHLSVAPNLEYHKLFQSCESLVHEVTVIELPRGNKHCLVTDVHYLWLLKYFCSSSVLTPEFRGQHLIKTFLYILVHNFIFDYIQCPFQYYL